MINFLAVNARFTTRRTSILAVIYYVGVELRGTLPDTLVKWASYEASTETLTSILTRAFASAAD